MTGYPLRQRIAAVEPATTAAAPRLHDSARAAGGVRLRRIAGRADDQPRHRRCARATCCRYRDRLFIIHGTGLFKGGAYDARSRHAGAAGARATREEERALIDAFYVARPFFYQIEHVYAVADLVVARARRRHPYELASLGLPAIVVPKANLPGDHQVMNARAMARCGGATVLYEETTLAGERIIEELDGGRLAFRSCRCCPTATGSRDMSERGATFVTQDALDIIERSIRGERHRKPRTRMPRRACGRRRRRCRATRRCWRSSSGPRRVRARPTAPNRSCRRPDDRAYFVSRAASLLASTSWEQRNLGVKLLGLLHARDKLPLLLALLADKRPAPWPQAAARRRLPAGRASSGGTSSRRSAGSAS